MFDKPIDIPDRFVDDGASHAPDSIGRTNLRHIFRIHDWRYCTRCHPPGELTTEWRKLADKEMKLHMNKGLPWYVRWTRFVYWWGVRKFGNRDNSFDSCGYDKGSYCRHNMPMPEWMKLQGKGKR